MIWRAYNPMIVPMTVHGCLFFPSRFKMKAAICELILGRSGSIEIESMREGEDTAPKTKTKRARKILLTKCSAFSKAVKQAHSRCYK